MADNPPEKPQEKPITTEQMQGLSYHEAAASVQTLRAMVESLESPIHAFVKYGKKHKESKELARRSEDNLKLMHSYLAEAEELFRKMQRPGNVPVTPGPPKPKTPEPKPTTPEPKPTPGPHDEQIRKFLEDLEKIIARHNQIDQRWGVALNKGLGNLAYRIWTTPKNEYQSEFSEHNKAIQAFVEIIKNQNADEGLKNKIVGHEQNALKNFKKFHRELELSQECMGKLLEHAKINVSRSNQDSNNQLLGNLISEMNQLFSSKTKGGVKNEIKAFWKNNYYLPQIWPKIKKTSKLTPDQAFNKFVEGKNEKKLLEQATQEAVAVEHGLIKFKEHYPKYMHELGEIVKYMRQYIDHFKANLQQQRQNEPPKGPEPKQPEKKGPEPKQPEKKEPEQPERKTPEPANGEIASNKNTNDVLRRYEERSAARREPEN